jgi:hypothetical protein
MLRRSLIVFAGLSFCQTALAQVTALRRVKIFTSKYGKPALTISAAALSGAVSARVLDSLEHVDDDAPVLMMTSYFVLHHERKWNDAQAFWLQAPSQHFDFMRTVEDLFIIDVQPVSRTSSRATVYVRVSLKQLTRESEEWGGNVELVWQDKHWLIRAMYLKKQARSVG